MSLELNNFISTQTWFRVLNVLETLRRPGTLREIAELSEISLGGTSDVLRRLVAAKLVSKIAKGSRAVYALALAPEELRLVRQIAEQSSAAEIDQRAALLSTKSHSAIGWIEQTSAVIRDGKRSKNDAP